MQERLFGTMIRRTDVVIRSIAADDILEVIHIASKALPEEYDSSLFISFFEVFPKGFLIAEKKGEIIGFIVGVVKEDEWIRMVMFAVSEHYRNQGVGSQLLDRFLKEMEQIGAKGISLEVKEENHLACSLYSRYGFTKEETMMHFYNDGSNAIVMKKRIG